MKKDMTPMQRKLAMLSADILPYLGTAIGAAAGGVGAPVGGALGGAASTALKSFIPPEQQEQQMNMLNRPMIVGGQGGGMIDLDQQIQQQQMMDMMAQGGGQGMGPNMGALGGSLGQLGGAGIMGLLGLLSPQQTPQQSLWGKMDDSLKEKLARMVALKQALGSQ